MKSAGRLMKLMTLAGTLVVLCASSSAAQGQAGTDPAQASSQNPPAPQPLPQPSFTVTVIETAPLPGVNLPIDKIPAPVQTADDRDILDSGALDLSDFLNRRLNG